MRRAPGPSPSAPRRAAQSCQGGSRGTGAVPLSSAFQVEGSALGKRSRGTGEAGRGADTPEKGGQEG